MFPRTVQRYGWKRDLPDHRDFPALFHHQSVAQIPLFVDLRPQVPLIYDQSTIGSCTANAINADINLEMVKQGVKPLFGSRLFVYYNERSMEGTVNEDSGAQIRDGFSTISKLGVCPETDWPYDVNKFTIKPPDNCYTDGTKHLVKSYLSLNQNVTSLQDSLAAGYSFVFGFSVFESFEGNEVAKTGIVPMPHWREKMAGGHAVHAVGYNASNKEMNDVPPQHFIVQNSWGDQWGIKGYFYFPFSYISNAKLADDFWTVRLM